MTNIKAIQTVTVGAGGIAEIDFQSIPQTYTDLMLVLSTREESSASAEIFLKFNNNTSNLQTRWLRGNGSSATTGTTSNMQLLTNSNSALASTFSNTYFYIPNYAGSSNKSAMSDGVVENNVLNSPDIFQNMAAYLWSNTAAITRITAYLSTGDIAQHSTATLYGISNTIASGAKAYGGSVTEDSNYFYHTFFGSGVFTPLQNLTVDYLVVAGGGGSCQSRGGGGGGGGLRSSVTATGGGGSLGSPLSLTAQDYAVTVGAGGAGTSGSNNAGAAGSGSSFSTISTTGGGGGGGGLSGSTPPTTGGSGGGAGFSGSAGISGAAGTANQGFAGGSSTQDTGGTGAGGGGGGAGAVGGDGSNSGSGTGGNGGAGVTVVMSSSATYAGGGGGSGRTTSGTGGAGGGGKGGSSSLSYSSSGTANTGGGAGGGGDTIASNGGSGIVIIRYAK